MDIKDEEKEDNKEKEERLYTDEEVNAISLKNEQKAIDKLLKSMGLKSEEEAKVVLSEIRKAEESKESDEGESEKESSKEETKEDTQEEDNSKKEEEESEKVLSPEKSEEVKEDSNESVDLEEKAKRAIVQSINLSIENALLVKGIDASKSNRLSRLVNKEHILNEEGYVDSDKLNTEIESVLKEFPELISKSKEEKGFVIGSDGQETKRKNPLEALEKAMGIK